MSHEIVFEPHALDSAARFLEEDPNGFTLALGAIGELADDPRPVGSTPYMSPDVRRLRVAGHRALYVIGEDMIRIRITHLGRTT
ncbi:type II toxin-antitoxin system RelE/ParE family toxin [Streptomyces sp. NPDC047081]|uniref:type II toxin-antitoxin system RelE family toxin n=1 Tax=Streptomyces sp. NPDC047081 TaxID=3154706 RepID=UPI00340A60E3